MKRTGEIMEIKQLEVTNTYDITTIVPWQRRVIFKTMYLAGIGTYSILNDKEGVIRELVRIESSLPEDLRNRSWVNDGSEFYVFNTQVTAGRKTVSIPVDLVNHDIATSLDVVRQLVTIHADNVRQLANVYRLLKDHDVRYTIDD